MINAKIEYYTEIIFIKFLKNYTPSWFMQYLKNVAYLYF